MPPFIGGIFFSTGMMSSSIALIAGSIYRVSMSETLPCFMDFEASSLSNNSYPIEVAWSTPDGSIESHLIMPTWEWTEWSDAAEAVQGISRELLKSQGKPAWVVAARMNECLRGLAYTDAPDFDGMWLARLFEQCSDDPKFELRHFDSLLPEVSPERLADLIPKARELAGGLQHRADVDVRFLVELYRLAKGIQ